MLVAAAVCPHPPLLVPEAMGLAGLPAAGGPPGRSPSAGSHSDLGDLSDDAQIRALRAACGAAVAGLAAARPDLIAVVGGADQTAGYEASAAGTLRSFGIPFTTGTGQPMLPLSLTVGSWLIRRFLVAGWQAAGAGSETCLVRLQAVRQSLPPAECLRLGADLAGLAPRVALLVLGDGSARKAIGVHGAADPAADEYDAALTAALAAADAGGLARLDAALDGELMVAGRAAWQVLAGAGAGARLRGQVRFAAAPLDVTYLVASWAS